MSAEKVDSLGTGASQSPEKEDKNTTDAQLRSATTGFEFIFNDDLESAVKTCSSPFCSISMSMHILGILVSVSWIDE